MLRLAPLLLALGWPASGLTMAPAPVLTLGAPPASRFGHRVEFVGRVIPAVPGARIRLYRQGTLVTTASARRDGTFRIPVRLERPGPFHVAWAAAFSPAVIIRVHPLLDVRLVGSQVVGQPLEVAVHLRPERAGPIRVRVRRDGRTASTRILFRSRRVALDTTSSAGIHIRVETLPHPGYAVVTRELSASLRPPLLSYGASSPAVAQLLRGLAALHYVVPRIQSSFDGDVLESIYAFQKVQGLPRTGSAGPAVWARLEHPLVPSPRYRQPLDHLEVDKTRQVLFVVRGGEISLISPVSTAGIAGYYTPIGRFAISRKVPGYDPSPLGVLYKPMYFTGGYAIHGNPSVPPYPASHGCVRVPNFVIEHLFQTEPYGETVYVY